MDSGNTWTYEGKTWTRSAEYGGMKNEVIEKFLSGLKETEEIEPSKGLIASGLKDGWVPLVMPDENGLHCWSWRKVKDAGPKSQFHIKMIHHYKGIHPDKLFEALTTEVRTHWDAQDVFKVISKDEANGSHIINQTFKRPPTNAVKQRDLCYEFFARKGYLNAEHGVAHVFASSSVDHDDCKPNSTYVRAIRHIAGNLIEALPDGSGARLSRIVVCDLMDGLEPQMVARASKNLGITIFNTLNGYCQ